MINPLIQYSNYATITVKSDTCLLKVGDVFNTNSISCRYKLFNGLIIQSISFNGFGGTNLHFERTNWEAAKERLRCQ
jgi:hypothetical protein